MVVNGKAVKKVVKTGIQDTRFIKILEGLKKDEEVISAPYEAINFKISDGGAVNVVDKEKLYEAVAK